MHVNKLFDVIDTNRSIIHRVSDCTFEFISNCLHKKILIPLYMVENNSGCLNKQWFHLDTGAAMTCMPLYDIIDNFNVSEYDYNYHRIHPFSGYSKQGVQFMIPIMMKHLIIGGFLFDDIMIYSPFIIKPNSSESVSNVQQEYDRLNSISFSESIPNDLVEKTKSDNYIDALISIYSRYIISKSNEEPTIVDKHSTYINLHNHFSFTPLNTSYLLGMDILNYFDIIITQPRHELVRDDRVHDDYGNYIYNQNRTRIGNLITEGNLYFSIPSEATTNSKRLALTNSHEDMNTQLPFSQLTSIDDIDENSNPVIQSYLNIESILNRYLYETVSVEGIIDNLSQNNVYIVNLTNTQNESSINLNALKFDSPNKE